MRERFVTALILVAIAALGLTGCGRSGTDEDGPTAIPIGDLVTPSPTRMAEQVMATPTPEPAPTEQVMATPTEQVMVTPTETPASEPSATPEPTEPVATPTATVEATEAPEATPEETPTAEPTEEATPEPTPEPVTHAVKAGENLFRIGLQYGVSWQEIAAANNLPAGNRIQVGQVLTIPVEPAEAPEAPEGRVHVVQPGETLFRIGLQYNVAWDAIARANGIRNPNTIAVGQELIIPGQAGSEAQGTETAEEPSEEETGATIHAVQPGETLFRIGLLYGMSWQVIAEANGITNPDYITVGTVLTIPAH